jgi:acyl carrier protein
MTREEVFERVRSYLATELAVDAGSIGDGTRFRDDLNADSLHLVELVVELEDSYGVRIPDDEAVKMETVGSVVDFVAAHVPEKTS